ncbi:MAG: hypothetical protein ACXVNO_03025 [Bacteroidia bacterium]
MIYEKRYTDWLEKASTNINGLPRPLAKLVIDFELALNNWQVAFEKEQAAYLPILEKTDAYISTCIYREFKDVIEKAITDKANRLAQQAADLNFND